MTLASITLKNFTVFEDARFDLCPGINVLLGANGTGKTHAMKVAFLAATSRRGSPDFFDRLAGCFMPERRNPGRLVRRPLGEPPGQAELRGVDDEGAENLVIVGHDGSARTNSAGRGQSAVYMPSRDVFSTFEGLIGADRKRALSFDETFFDLCLALDPPAGDVAPEAAPILRRLEELLGGEVVREGNRFYVQYTGGEKIEAQLVAEGPRKLATLVRLVGNGAIAAGTTLFWDEPETGLDPTLIAHVAGVLGELAKIGVQVVVATHERSLASRLSQLAGQMPVRRFNLVREAPNGAVRVAVSDVQASERPRLLVNIDVADLAAAVEFYSRAFGFTVGRRLGDAGVELLGAEVPVYLLVKEAGSAAASTTSATRDYARHWTPVHLDVVVDDLEAALARAQAAGARVESPVREASWGSMALLADPWGHGLCLIKFSERGYDAIAT